MERDFEQQLVQDWLVRTSGISVNAESGRRRYPGSVKSEMMIPKILGIEGIRQKELAQSASKSGHRKTALKIYELAIRNLIEAQHNIFSDTALKRHLMAEAQSCMDAVIGLAEHKIQRLNIPFEGKTLPALFHSRSESDPLLIYIPGMDGTKETSSIGPLAEPFISRGFQVLAVDGPGQGEARTLQGIRLKKGNYLTALKTVLNDLSQQGLWAGDDAWVIGSSLGTRWALELASNDDRIKAVALLHAAFGDLGPLIYSAPPRFHKVLKYMTGLDDDDLDDFIRTDQLMSSVKVSCPTLVCIGEFDPLTSIGEARDLYQNNLGGPKQLVVLEDAFHGSEGVASLIGMNGTDLAADWISDRIQGKPFESAELLIGKGSLGPYKAQPLTDWQILRTQD